MIALVLALVAQEKPKLDPAKEFAAINQQADAAHKELKSFSADVRFQEGEGAGIEAKLRAKRLKGEMWARLDSTAPGRAPSLNVVNQKLTELWPASKEYRRTDYAKRKDQYPVEVFLGWQYQPSKYKPDFDLKLKQLAGKYVEALNPVDPKAKKEAPKADDPFADKKKKFEGETAPKGETPKAETGPDPLQHHVVELVARDPKLKAALGTVFLHVHYKTHMLAQIEVRYPGEDARVLRVSLFNVATGVEHPDREMLVDTRDWTEKK